MSNQLNTFDFEGWPINVFIRDGEPWFVANDVGKMLGLPRHGRDITKYLAPFEKDGVISPTPGGNQRVVCVSESGLYALIFRSRKPEAKQFRQWVTSELLPAIRKTGHYAVQQPTQGVQTTKPNQPTVGSATLDVSALTPTQRLTINALVEQLSLAGAR